MMLIRPICYWLNVILDKMHSPAEAASQTLGACHQYRALLKHEQLFMGA